MNVLTVTGRLTDDPVHRDTTNGAVRQFRLAIEPAGQRRSPHDEPAAPIGGPGVMAGHRRDRGNRWLSTCVGVTIALSVYAFVTGPGWTRPLFFLMLGLTAILAAGELRRTGWSTADEAAMQLLIDTGRMPNGATGVTTQCPEGSVIAVWSGPSELPPGRYFVDLDGAVYSLSSSCGSAQRFVELSPDTAAREPFAIRADGAR